MAHYREEKLAGTEQESSSMLEAAIESEKIIAASVFEYIELEKNS